MALDPAVAGLDWAHLEAGLSVWQRQWRTAQPFRHVILDGLFTPEALRALQTTFPTPTALWTSRRHLHSRKFTCADRTLMPVAHLEAFTALAHPAWLDWLTRLTGVPGLAADPALYGGGLHVTQRGGYLDFHADFLQSTLMPGQQRALNLLVYLTRDYDPAWGGALELGALDEPGHRFPRIVRSIAPIANRAVCFATSAESWHGHPVPWASATPRESLACYYYVPTTTPGGLTTTDYRPLRRQWGARAHRAVGRALRAVGWRRDR